MGYSLLLIMIPSIIIYGLVNSVILALIAMGFSLTFGISGVANFAYGGFYILSGFLVWMLLNYLKFPFILAIVVTIGVVGFLGFVTYWVILLRVRGIALSEVIATYALGVGILELFRWLGFVTYEFTLPYFKKGHGDDRRSACRLSTSLHHWDWIGDWSFSYTFLLTTHGLVWPFGALPRMSAPRYPLAFDRILRLPSAWPSGRPWPQLLPSSFSLWGSFRSISGYEVLLIAVAVGIVGGLESVPGILVASLILGYAQVITGTYFSPEWMMVVYLAAIVIILSIKPSGLFGKFKELEERV